MRGAGGPERDTAMFALETFAIKIPGSRLRVNNDINIVFKTSKNRLLIQDSSRLSIELSGVLSRKTPAVLHRSEPCATRVSTEMTFFRSFVSVL